jgi:hypothetical protein
MKDATRKAASGALAQILAVTAMLVIASFLERPSHGLPAVSIGDQGGLLSLLISFWAASSASDSDAQSCGVTMLRTVSSASTFPDWAFGIMAARQCPGFRS